MNTNTTNTAKSRPDFEQVKRNYETALASGKDSTQELTALATAVAYSVLNKCIDPQRKTAADRETVSDNGYNPALVQLKRGIAADLATLDNLRTATNKATRTAYNADGDLTTETVDKDAEKAVAALVETLSDGIDLVNAAALAILEQAAEHADAPAWLDAPYNVRRLSRRVYIRTEDSRAYRDETTTPIQEVYRAVRQAVQDSRATQTDPATAIPISRTAPTDSKPFTTGCRNTPTSAAMTATETTPPTGRPSRTTKRPLNDWT